MSGTDSTPAIAVDVDERAADVTVAARLRAALERRDLAALAGLFTDDVLLDANLPSWRLRRQGVDAVTRQIDEWLPQPAQFAAWREILTDWGAVVECVERKLEPLGALHYRQVFLLFTEGQRIATFTLYCTGASGE